MNENQKPTNDNYRKGWELVYGGTDEFCSHPASRQKEERDGNHIIRICTSCKRRLEHDQQGG